MFFFRAVIHLLIRSKIYQYIAYQRIGTVDLEDINNAGKLVAAYIQKVK